MVGRVRFAAVIAAISCVISASGLSGTAAASVGLTGEVFIAGGGGAFGTVSYQTASCSNTAPTTFTYTAAGLALGPYPGRFTEQGSFTIQRDPSGLSPHGLLTAFTATFSIASTVGNVEGTMSLDQPLLVNYRCSPQGYQVGIGGTLVKYRATIEGAGPSADSGYAYVDIANPPELAYLNQHFVTKPKASDVCKDDGYIYQGFTTQGQCIQALG